MSLPFFCSRGFLFRMVSSARGPTLFFQHGSNVGALFCYWAWCRCMNSSREQRAIFGFRSRANACKNRPTRIVHPASKLNRRREHRVCNRRRWDPTRVEHTNHGTRACCRTSNRVLEITEPMFFAEQQHVEGVSVSIL